MKHCARRLTHSGMWTPRGKSRLNFIIYCGDCSWIAEIEVGLLRLQLDC